MTVGASSTTRRVRGRRCSALWSTAIAVILAGVLWYGLGRSDSVSVGVIVSECSQSLANNEPQNAEHLVPAVVGSTPSAGVAAFDTRSGWRWCFVGMGIGTGVIQNSALRSPVSSPVAVLDGGYGRDVLMLIHHDPRTETVAVDTAWSRSVVIAQADGFEVVRVPMSKWPRWQAPWSRAPVVLGRILGFDSGGRLTSSMPFVWCAGSIDVYPGEGC
jgi:hypothetical protein